jgi:replicative DNA helicase
MATAGTSLERPLPHNVEAERSILGAILLDNNAINPAIEKLQPEDFFHDHHRRIYQQMIALGESQQAIDLVTLTEQLQRSGELEAVGGAAYVSQLMDGVPHITNVEHYARIVKEKALLRGLIHATSAIQQQALEAEEDADAILDRAESFNWPRTASAWASSACMTWSPRATSASRGFTRVATASPALPPATTCWTT